MSDVVAAYNFIAAKLNWGLVQDETELQALPLPIRIPKKVSEAVTVADRAVLSSLFSALSGCYLIKVRNGQVLEFYIRNPIGMPANCHVAIDLKTNTPFEYYTDDGIVERKFDSATDKLLAENFYASFDKLPDDLKSQLLDYPQKDKIFGYSYKPYGAIVEIRAA